MNYNVNILQMHISLIAHRPIKNTVIKNKRNMDLIIDQLGGGWKLCTF